MVGFVTKRLALVPLQAIGVTLVTFLLVRLVPGDPATTLTGPFGTPQSRAAMRERLGLDETLLTQYWLYLKQVFQLDLGRSFATDRPVVADIGERLPATLELITVAIVLALVIGIFLGTLVALRPGGVADAMSRAYGLFAGSIPDFWLGLVCVYIFVFTLGWAPAPLGRLDPSIVPPPTVTSFLTIDSLVAGDLAAFRSAVMHLMLPVLTLVFVYTMAIQKTTRATFEKVLASDAITYARACGLSRFTIVRYTLRMSLPPIVTMSGLTYTFLLGGAVMVEVVFSWGGLGQYAVDAVRQSDYLALQGVVLVAAVFNLLVYLLIDVIDRIIDPRLEVGVGR